MNFKATLWGAIGGLLLAPCSLIAQHTSPQHHDQAHAFASIGVMADHTHEMGEWMSSYRSMHMKIIGSRVSNSDVLADYMVSPTDMRINMQMVGLMYVPTGDSPLMAMIPYLDQEMGHLTQTGARFTTRSEGLGDIKLTGMIPFYQEGPHSWQVNLGLGLPTGSIDVKDNTPAGRVRLGYRFFTDSYSYGGQTSTVLRMGRNDNDYSLVDRYNATSWFSRPINSEASVSLRLNYEVWGNIDGADPQLNPTMVPTADPDRRAGQQLDLRLGLNLQAPDGHLEGYSLAVEFGVPLWQKLDGPQLETDWILTFG